MIGTLAHNNTTPRRAWKSPGTSSSLQGRSVRATLPTERTLPCRPSLVLKDPWKEKRGEVMRKSGTNFVILALAALAVLGIAALSAAADSTKVKGLIVGRDGANILVKGEMASWTIELNDDTQVQAIKGKLGLRKDDLALTDLIPGLPVEVETINSGSSLVAI